jgi:hypothetical protein
MGQYMVEELDRYLEGVPLLWQIRPKHLTHSVHQLHLDLGANKQGVAAS